DLEVTPTLEGDLQATDPSLAASKELIATSLPPPTSKETLILPPKLTSTPLVTEEGFLTSNICLAATKMYSILPQVVVHVNLLLGRVQRFKKVADERMAGLASAKKMLEE
ncbi:unnamed protein product, partial [Ilex paraguariensis]